MTSLLWSSRQTFHIITRISVMACLFASGAYSETLLLHVPFDENVDAKVATGDSKGKFYPPTSKPESQPAFAEGIVGKALDIGGSGGCRVAYDVKENIKNERGSICFWAKRSGPKPEGRYTFHLGAWGNADGSWVLLYRWEWYAGVNMLHGRGGSGDEKVEVPGDGDDGNWHFFVFTWDGEHARGYIDGETSASADNAKFPAQQFGSFYVGGGDSTSRLIDELKIYDEPLSVSEIKAMYREVAGISNNPSLIIPRRTTSIAVDGKVKAEEWDTAVETTGLVAIEKKQYAPTQTTVRALYDDEALYLAFDSTLPEKVKKDYAMTAGMTGILRQTRDRYDTDVDGDDAIEINVMPQWPAESQYPAGMWHRLVVNGLNTHYDYTVSDKNIISLDWNPQWDSASSLDANGWHVEVRLPFSSFGVAAPKPGERWGLNFIRIWQALQSGREAWRVAPMGSPGYRYAVGPVQFGGADAPVVQLTDWGPVSDNVLAARGKVTNPTDKPMAVRAQVTSDSPEVKLQQDLNLKPGASASLKFDSRLQEPATSTLTLEVSDPSGKTCWFRSQVPVAIRQVLEITSANYPTSGIFKAMVDAGRLRSTPLKDLELSLTMLDAQNKPALPAKHLAPMPGYTCEIELDVKSLKPGKYQARCVIQSRDGRGVVKQVAEKFLNYEKLPLPEWLGNTIGITDKAPKPFTPLRRNGDTIECWGREYRYDGRLFPTQITSQKGELLKSPIELLLTAEEVGNGRRAVPVSSTTVTAKAKWGKSTDFRVEFERSVQLGKVPVTTSSWIECDGFLWTTLKIPACKQTINNLVVRVPLTKEWSEYINPYDYSTVTSGKLKPEGWKGGGQPLWLGNGSGGFQFTCETLAQCKIKPETSPLRVIPGESANVMEITLIDTPTKLDKPFEVAWGWVATPTRPKTPGYRGWATGNAPILPGYQWYVPSGKADFDPRWLGYSHFVGEVNRPDGKGKALGSGGPYVVTSACPVYVPEYGYWGDEWSPSRIGRRADGGIGQCSVACKSWVDYFVWLYRQTYKRGRFVGLYYDCAPYLPDDNIYHGAGYREGQRILPTNNVLAAREIAKRMYCMLRELEPEQTMILYHNSGCIDMSFLSWCDVYVDGENFTSRLSKNDQDYHRVFSPDSFLAQSMGHNFGPANYLLDEFNRSGATTEEDWKRLGVQPVTQLYGLILLHDSTYWKAYGIPEGYKMVDAALAKYHFDDSYTMMPYWNQKIVKLPEKVFATFYRNDAEKRVLIVLLNNNETDLKLRLQLDWKALGFSDPRKLTVDDAVFHEGASIENGELVTPVGRANMRLLAVEEK